MSIFDTPRIWLNPAIFDKSDVMHPHVLNYLQEQLAEIFPLASLNAIVLAVFAVAGVDPCSDVTFKLAT